MTLICSHSYAFISTIAKHVLVYILNLQSFEVARKTLVNAYSVDVSSLKLLFYELVRNIIEQVKGHYLKIQCLKNRL